MSNEARIEGPLDLHTSLSFAGAIPLGIATFQHHMGRVSRRRADQHRNEIVAAASKLFCEHGADNVSISDVMVAAGLTHGAFYHHFPSKEALVKEAAVAAFDRASNAWMSAPTASAPSPLCNLISRYLNNETPEHRCPTIAFSVTNDSGEALRKAYGDGARALFEAFTNIAASGTAPPKEERLRLLFCALLGAKLLSNSIEDSAWTSALHAAVIKAAKR